MNCLNTNEMAAFLDQAGSTEEESRWREHFRRCAKCRKAMEELSALLCLDPLEPGEDCAVKGKALLQYGAALEGGTALAPPGKMTFGKFGMQTMNLGGN